MRYVVADDFGPVEDLAVREGEVPAPGRGEVLIEVRAAGVGFVDGLLVQGLYQVKPPLPYVPGMSLSGVVGQVGAGVDGVAIGGRVVAIGHGGAFATHAVAPAVSVVPLPDAVSHEQAAGMVESWGTMHFALTRRIAVLPGARVLVLGAGGGIGLAAVDIASSLGAEVIAAASSEDKLATAAAAGATHLVDYRASDLRDALREHAPQGVDIVIDPVGGDVAQTAMRALAPFGSYLVLGFASGDIPRLGANRVLIGNHTVVGVDFGDAVRRDPTILRPVLDEVFARVADGTYSTQGPQVLPLDDAAGALRALGDRAVVGKIVLVP